MSSLVELLIKFIIRAIRRSGCVFSHGLLTLVAAFGIGCVGGSGSSSETSAPDLAPSPGTVAKSVSRKSGRDFSCVSFELSGGSRVWCRTEGPGVDVRFGFAGPTYSLYIAASVPLVSFETWDDTLCISANVSLLPENRTPGLATYCFGDANLGFNQMSYPIVYGGPVFSSALHGSPELSFGEEPFSGGDHSMDLMTDTGGVWLVMLDSSSEVSVETLSCALEADGTTLTCPDFTLTGVL